MVSKHTPSQIVLRQSIPNKKLHPRGSLLGFYGGLAQLGERLHGMQEVSGSIPLFSTKKALYFVGSTVLFFFVPAKRSGVHRSPCRRASDTPDLHNSRHLPCRFNRGFRRGLRRQHGAGPTAPAPAWQALAGARAVRQRGRRNGKSYWMPLTTI